MDNKGHFIAISDGNEEHVMRNWRKGGKQLVRLPLSSHVLWKLELVREEIGSLAEEISKQNAEGASWLLTAYGKI